MKPRMMLSHQLSRYLVFNHLIPRVFVHLVGKQAILEQSDLKSENNRLSVELCMPNLVFYFWPFLLLSKPLKIDPVMELSRVARFVKLAQ